MEARKSTSKRFTIIDRGGQGEEFLEGTKCSGPTAQLCAGLETTFETGQDDFVVFRLLEEEPVRASLRQPV